MDEVLTETKLYQLQQALPLKHILILKFTAEWCAPCQAIKPLCEEYIKKFPPSIFFFEVDIEESIELYTKLKKHKMLNGIPAIMVFYPGERDKWYIPDDTVLGGDKKLVKELFERCLKYVS